MQVIRIKEKIMVEGGPATRRPSPGINAGCARVCLHVLTGRVDAPKVCTRQFECYHCAFDQLLDDMDTVVESRPLPAGYATASL